RLPPTRCRPDREHRSRTFAGSSRRTCDRDREGNPRTGRHWPTEALSLTRPCRLLLRCIQDLLQCLIETDTAHPLLQSAETLEHVSPHAHPGSVAVVEIHQPLPHIDTLAIAALLVPRHLRDLHRPVRGIEEYRPAEL